MGLLEHRNTSLVFAVQMKMVELRNVTGNVKYPPRSPDSTQLAFYMCSDLNNTARAKNRT
jgi:hypothetical protein